MPWPNRTKIVATLGPVSAREDVLHDMVRAGVDVVRLNCAHNDHETLIRNTRLTRKVAESAGRALGVLADLQGPKIRVGRFKDAEPIFLKRGQKLVLSTEPGVIGEHRDDYTRIGCGYEGLAADVRPGERILLDDGNMELRVRHVEGTEITTRVVYGGMLHQFKGINLPGSKVSMASLSEKDLADLKVVLEHGVDFVALSFVRREEDVEELRSHIRESGSDAQIVAKIERPEAIKRLDSIVEAADALMVARGDMGVELGPEAVPAVQKRIIAACLRARKSVITATQMLESMVVNPRPTRAEASDVANAIYDGTSAVMLSAETATGKHPVRAVRIMDKIIRSSERDLFNQWEYRRRRRRGQAESVALATVRAAAYAAYEAEARLIAVFTESGSTAQLLAGERTPTRCVAFTPFDRTLQRLALTWGITARKVPETDTSHEMTLAGEETLKEEGLASSGDRIVVIAGTIRQTGLTNTMNIRVLE